MGDDLAGGGLGAHVACGAQALIRLGGDPAERKPLGDFEGPIGRAVIDDDDLVIGIVERFERDEAGLHRALSIVGADHHGNPGVTRQWRRQRPLVTRGDLIEGRLRLALAVNEPERPILDQMAAGEPFIGPSKNEGARDARGKRGPHLPPQDLGLLLIAVAHRIDAELGQHQRLVEGKIVEAGDVPAERGFVVQIDVEAQKIGEIDRQVLGRRKIGVADQRTGMLPAYQRYQLLQEPPHLLRPVPADHVRRDLIADEIGEHRGMAAAGAHTTDYRLADLRLYRGIVEERDML